MSLTTPDIAGAEGLWVSISDLAGRKRVTKQTISERVARFERDGLVTTRPGPGRAKLVNVAQYDRAAGDVGDQARETGARTRGFGSEQLPPNDAALPESSASTYSREQAREKAYAADLKRLDLEERLGQLIPVRDLTDATVRCGEALIRVIDQIIGRAEDMAGAVARDGVPGARAQLKAIASDLKTRAGEEFAKLATVTTAEGAALQIEEDDQ